MNKIHVLSKGYCRVDVQDNKVSYANGTCTLVRTRQGENIIVDTLTSWDGEQLKLCLGAYGIEPKDIHYVVCTHAHSDHIGCNYLFLDARWHFIGTTISKEDKFLEWDFSKPFNLSEDGSVQVLHTPGHTNSCVSVIVRDSPLGTVGICGDLFERVEDIWDQDIWLKAGSEDPQKQKLSRSKMIQMCTHIIPGHGEMFRVTKQMIGMLRISRRTDEQSEDQGEDMRKIK